MREAAFSRLFPAPRFPPCARLHPASLDRFSRDEFPPRRSSAIHRAGALLFPTRRRWLQAGPWHVRTLPQPFLSPDLKRQDVLYSPAQGGQAEESDNVSRTAHSSRPIDNVIRTSSPTDTSSARRTRRPSGTVSTMLYPRFKIASGPRASSDTRQD